jgi:hypothetical protein
LVAGAGCQLNNFGLGEGGEVVAQRGESGEAGSAIQHEEKVAGRQNEPYF